MESNRFGFIASALVFGLGGFCLASGTIHGVVIQQFSNKGSGLPGAAISGRGGK
jgi:hypothetical protein